MTRDHFFEIPAPNGAGQFKIEFHGPPDFDRDAAEQHARLLLGEIDVLLNTRTLACHRDAGMTTRCSWVRGGLCLTVKRRAPLREEVTP